MSTAIFDTVPLAGWLARQRWFARKDLPIDAVEVGADTELLPGLRHLVVEVRQGPVTDRYQLLLGSRTELPGRLTDAEIGRTPPGDERDGPHLYDAVHDPEMTPVLLANIARGASVGPLRFRHLPGHRIVPDLAGEPVPGEQSNTSLVFGDAYICKLFRRLSPGVNPDLEINLALTEAGCAHVPAVHGWIELAPEDGGEPTTLGLLSEYLRTGTDGWQMAVTSVRDWFAHPRRPGRDDDPGQAGGDFAAEAERLGAATAAVHRDLARAFGVTRVPADEIRARARAMHRQLAEVCTAVPALEPYRPAIAAAFDEGMAATEDLPVQRVHGDFHLGQALRSDTGWMLLDFEGEPARTPAERRARAHPLRDVAGMLRSFEYAARFLQADDASLTPESALEQEERAHAWARRNRDAFCRGYADAGGTDPSEHTALLRALEFDKAVYEVLYEARNRPEWLAVPLRSLAHLAT